MKIGIITMHKVQNYGSALQAYALQKAISDEGYYCELIDYIFPKSNSDKSLYNRLKHLIINLYLHNSLKKRENKFNSFYKKFFKCSHKAYYSHEELIEDTPKYDLYITGSDQVWKESTILNDPSFLLDFIPINTPRISYAASFATKNISPEYSSIYSKYLSRYKYLSVREESGVTIIKNLTSQNATLVCDPTLLINGNEWKYLIQTYNPPINKPYILAYILRYAYDPYPEVNKIIDDIQSITGMHLIILGWTKDDKYRKNTTIIKDAGPLDFINLIANASFVITTSFHGTAFSINLNIPFYSIVSQDNNDRRIIDLLSEVGAKDRALIYNNPPMEYNLKMDYKSINNNLNELKDKSKVFLKSAIKSAINYR